MADETTLVLTRKVFKSETTNFTPGERSMVAWISTDCVDHELDVVVSSGVDYKTYFMGVTPDKGNPCVLAVHDTGKWPLGKCAWIQSKQSKDFNGLYAKTILDEDAESEKVWLKIKSGSLKGISIGFRPPDDLQNGEWGPPTPEEIRRRPDWKTARRIIRRCVLLEYSVCSLPMNPQALIAAVNKGLQRPVYEGTKAMDPETPEVDPEEEKSECSCGEKDCEKCQERMTVKDEPEEGGEGEAPDPEADDFDEEDETTLPVKTHDHVDIKAKGFRGCGQVKQIHRRGMVDHVDEDLTGTKDEPAARVQIFKAHGDGHVPTKQQRGFKLKELTRRDSPFKAPSKGKSLASLPAPEISPMGETLEDTSPLPVIRVKSDQEVRAELIAKLNEMLSPEGFRRIAREEAERAAGFV